MSNEHEQMWWWCGVEKVGVGEGVKVGVGEGVL